MTLYQEVRSALRESAFRPRKRLGQNFLIHERVVDGILKLLELGADDEVLEIGPGLGVLTRRLVASARRVYAVEVDDWLVQRLAESSLGAHSRLRLIHGDILKLSPALLPPSKKIKAVGNLPYSIATPTLFRLLEWREHFVSLVLMLQKEVADRIVSGPGSKAYGALSVWCQTHGRVVGKLQVAPEAFFPRPKVRSAVVKIELFDAPRIAPEVLPVLRDLLHAAFGQRRKTLGNAMMARLNRGREAVEAFLSRHDIDPRRRGETLSVEEFLRLGRALGEWGPLSPAADR